MLQYAISAVSAENGVDRLVMLEHLMTFLVGLVSGIAVTFGKKWIDHWFERTRLSVVGVDLRERSWGNPIPDGGGGFIGYSHNQVVPLLRIVNTGKHQKARVAELRMEVWKGRLRRTVSVVVPFEIVDGKEPIGQGEELVVSPDADRCNDVLQRYSIRGEAAVSFMIRDVVSGKQFRSRRERLAGHVFEPWELNSSKARVRPEISGASDPSALAGWRGVTVGNRFFAWEGPKLHQLPEQPGAPEPGGLIEAIRKAQMTPSYGTREKLSRHLASGRLQVFETDRTSYKRPIIGGGSGEDQLLLVKLGVAP